MKPKPTSPLESRSKLEGSGVVVDVLHAPSLVGTLPAAYPGNERPALAEGLANEGGLST
ncbi:MAG: hypothetical protein ABR973_15340 [Candidatus Acidiferrales bacterium]